MRVTVYTVYSTYCIFLLQWFCEGDDAAINCQEVDKTGYFLNEFFSIPFIVPF